MKRRKPSSARRNVIGKRGRSNLNHVTGPRFETGQFAASVLDGTSHLPRQLGHDLVGHRQHGVDGRRAKAGAFGQRRAAPRPLCAARVGEGGVNLGLSCIGPLGHDRAVDRGDDLHHLVFLGIRRTKETFFSSNDANLNLQGNAVKDFQIVHVRGSCSSLNLKASPACRARWVAGRGGPARRAALRRADARGRRRFRGGGRGGWFWEWR